MGGGGGLTTLIIYLVTWISNIDFKYTGNQQINANTMYDQYAKTQIRVVVTVKLISACFCYIDRTIPQCLILNPKFQVSNHLLLLYSLVCVRPGRKPDHLFSHDAAQI